MPNWKKVITSGSNAELSSLFVAGAITASGAISASGDLTANNINAVTSLTASGLIYPTTDGDDGNILMTDGAGSLTLQPNTSFFNVKNVGSSTLLKGTPVHATGTTGNTSEVIAASASSAPTMPATYVLAEDIDADDTGRAILTGYLNGIDTSNGFTPGDVVYVGEQGGYTPVKPSGSNLIQNIGIIIKSDASNGSVLIYGSGRSNDVPNITSGYAWVGNSDQVATAVATSSFVVDNANTASYVAAANIDGTIDISDQTNLAGGTNLTLSGDTMNLDANISLTSITASGAISASGAITGSDVYINDWGSVSASLAAAGGGGAVATYTNGSDNRIITSTGTDGINGEANLTFDGTSLTLTGNITASGNISSSGTSDNFFGGRLVLDNSKYVAGTETGGQTRNILSIDGSNITQVANGNLATNIKGTSISIDNALTVDTGDITATNGNVHLDTNNTQLTGKLTGGATRDLIGFNASDSVVVGNTTADSITLVGNTELQGNLNISEAANSNVIITGSITHKFPDATYTYQGELSPLAGTGLTAGEIVHYSGSGWVVADASDTTATKHLGVAVSTTEVLTRGYVRNTAYAGLGTGNVLYLSTTAGDVTITAPSTAGEYVRVLGYCLDSTTRVIYFNPSQDWIEL